ncbi:putative integral membrane protein [Acanthocheilonema viteae]
MLSLIVTVILLISMDITDRRTVVPVLLLIFLIYPIVIQSEICYRCANEFIVMYWGRFLPIQSEDELVADSVCIKIDERSEEVRCVGPCLTLNVTVGEGNSTRTIGMMRDCQKKYYSRNSYNDEGNRRCRNRTVKIRRRILNAEYCFCLGNYCNGDGDEVERSMSEFRKISKYTKIRNNQRNGISMKWSLCNVPYLMLIYIVCWKLYLISL